MSTKDQPERGPARLAGPPARVLIIEAPYYAAIVGGMREAAEAVLREAGCTVEVVQVAGAFELPAALRMAVEATRRADGPRWDGFLVMGCVVRGETDHYTFICEATCKGVMDIASATGIPLGFALLTVDTIAQAEARSAPGRHNKGAEAAHALVGQIALARFLSA
ncbi:MAG: 6,7-dimethyl-8-ribityllumazine synthase [Acetobacteraceae bacterium]|nr:6,7-dimethyl-8-ribityllumazine synthase [Acetobacteraceae bacterium]